MGNATPSPTCFSDAELLSLVGDDAMVDTARRHLDTCADCRRRLNEMQETVSRRDETPRSAGPTRTLHVAAPPAFGLGEPVVPAAPSPLPEMIGKYRVIAELGVGGQGRVFRVAHPTLSKELVVKVSRRPLRAAGGERDLLVAEGKILAELDHPNLARVYDLDVADNHPFLVMEYVRGTSLQQRHKQDPLSPRQAALLLAKVARAVGSAHARGIVHRDLKPANIVLDERGEPHVIDFGIASLQDAWSQPTTDSSAISGTLGFMAPEQARGEPVDARSDVFALGGVLYSLLVGHAPFAAKLTHEAFARAQRGAFDQESLHEDCVPRQLREICLHAMAVEPADRYRSAEELAEVLEQFAAPRRRRSPIVVGLVAVLLLVGVAFWFFRPTQQPAAPVVPASQARTELAVTVRRGGRKEELVDAIPLRTGDHLQVFAQLPLGTYASLFWFDSEGVLHPLAVETGTTTSATIVHYPSQHESVTLTGPSGTEVLLLCARRSRPITSEEVRGLFDANASWPELPDDSVVRIENDRVFVAGTRGPGMVADLPEKHVLQRAETLRQQLAQRFDYAQGAVFPHRD